MNLLISLSSLILSFAAGILGLVVFINIMADMKSKKKSFVLVGVIVLALSRMALYTTKTAPGAEVSANLTTLLSSALPAVSLILIYIGILSFIKEMKTFTAETDK